MTEFHYFLIMRHIFTYSELQEKAIASAQGGEAASDKPANQKPASAKPANKTPANPPSTNERLPSAPAVVAEPAGGAHYVTLTGDPEKDKKIRNLSKVCGHLCNYGHYTLYRHFRDSQIAQICFPNYRNKSPCITLINKHSSNWQLWLNSITGYLKSSCITILKCANLQKKYAFNLVAQNVNKLVCYFHWFILTPVLASENWC